MSFPELDRRLLRAMDWYYAISEQRFGPVAESVLIDKLSSGEISRTALVWNASMSQWVSAFESPLASKLPGPPPIPKSFSKVKRGATTRLVSGVGQLTDKVFTDLKELTPQFLMPFEEIRSLRWLKDKSLLALAGIGLFPLLCLTVFDDLKSAYWALALYFSVLWALFFYRQFPSEQVTKKAAFGCFFGTGLISISILTFIQKVPPIPWLGNLAESDNFLTHFFGMFAGVAILEELCKLMVVAVIVKAAAERLTLQTVLFYGLMSGLGFGIYEGVMYQTGWNFRARNVGTYYLLNVIRLTTLPFLHAVWTGIASYFIGLSTIYLRRKHGLIVAAIFIPALLHALHNSLDRLLAFGVDFLSVLALLVYLRQSSAFERHLSVPHGANADANIGEMPIA